VPHDAVRHARGLVRLREAGGKAWGGGGGSDPSAAGVPSLRLGAEKGARRAAGARVPARARTVTT